MMNFNHCLEDVTLKIIVWGIYCKSDVSFMNFIDQFWNIKEICNEDCIYIRG